MKWDSKVRVWEGTWQLLSASWVPHWPWKEQPFPGAVTLKPWTGEAGARKEQEGCQEAEDVYHATGPLPQPITPRPVLLPTNPSWLVLQTLRGTLPDLSAGFWLLSSWLQHPGLWLCPWPSGFCLYWTQALPSGLWWAAPGSILFQLELHGLGHQPLGQYPGQASLTPRETVEDLSRDNRTEQPVYRSSSV